MESLHVIWNNDIIYDLTNNCVSVANRSGVEEGVSHQITHFSTF